MQRTAQVQQPTDVRLRLVALPTEHGGWGFLLEPIVLGLLVAPSAGGLLLGIAAIGAFLARHPLTLALGDRRRGKRYPRTAWAERFALLYGLTALVSFAAALVLAPQLWPALLLGAPLALVQHVYDLKKQSRELVPEVAGAWALSVSAPAIALAGGWAFVPALGLWLVLAVRAATAIVYVRAHIRRLRGLPAPSATPLVAHALGLALLVGLAAAGLVPWLAAAALAVLLGRAAYGLAPGRAVVRPATIGKRELGYGVVTVILTAVGVLVGV